MPRLVGKPSNSGSYIALLLLAVVGIAGVAEYAGVINEVPGFGRDYASTPVSKGGASRQELQNPQSAKGQSDASINDSPSATQ